MVVAVRAQAAAVHAADEDGLVDNLDEGERGRPRRLVDDGADASEVEGDQPVLVRVHS